MAPIVYRKGWFSLSVFPKYGGSPAIQILFLFFFPLSKLTIKCLTSPHWLYFGKSCFSFIFHYKFFLPTSSTTSTDAVVWSTSCCITNLYWEWEVTKICFFHVLQNVTHILCIMLHNCLILHPMVADLGKQGQSQNCCFGRGGEGGGGWDFCGV